MAPKLEWRHGFIYKAELARIKRMPMHRFLEHLRLQGSMYPDPRPRLQHLAKRIEDAR